MTSYLIKRFLLIIPTLFGIMLVNFIIVQLAPGGPIDEFIAQQRGHSGTLPGQLVGDNPETPGPMDPRSSAATRGIDPALLDELKKELGFDKPVVERFFWMMGKYLTFDFGTSFFKGRPVTELILERLPVSISLGLWSMLIIYGISIPLGIRKAVRDGSVFDMWTTTVIITGYAIPGFLFAILLVVLFAGGSFLGWFPLGGLVSDHWQEMGWGQLILDYFWHLVLPISALVVGGFASLTILTKNTFLDQISQQYVLTARSKGLSEKNILYGHVFRNAMLLVIAGLPAAIIGLLFTGSLLIEVIFSLNGLGLLGYEAAIGRDYPVLFGTLYFFTLLGLIINIISDICYVLVDPRIDFAATR
ncbi:MAG TPA: microcin C ABC transporter permease YejB [Alphaproteobacteria bacterium]|nr:microcin C ABC transporter permease YejB [Alphaproteobacteria bacterium]